MTFFQARAISQNGFFHVRREIWATGKWFIVWRGVWFHFDTGIFRIVTATDYSADDLLATDWTTVPGPLTSCPVVPPSGPGDPGSPGGVPPGPSFPAFPPTPPDAPPPYGPIGGGGGPLPPPSRHGLSVTFNGLIDTNSPPPYPRTISDCSDSLNGNTFHLTRSSATTWSGTKTAGILGPDHDGYQRPILWKTIVRCPTFGDPNAMPYVYAVDLFWKNTFGGLSGLGGFATTIGQIAGVPITNSLASGTAEVSGGTATVNVG